jgi:hypothetical protein
VDVEEACRAQHPAASAPRPHSLVRLSRKLTHGASPRRSYELPLGSPAVSLGPRLLAQLLVRFPVLRDLCCSTQVMMSVVQATAALGRKPADAPFDTCMKADPLECRTRRTRRHLLMKTPCC